MTAAIFGLLGVFVGGCLQIIGEWVKTRRNERRRARVAAYVIHQEVLALLGVLKAVLDNEIPNARLPTRPLLDVWEAHRVDLTDIDGWPAVAMAASLVRVGEHVDEHDLSLDEALQLQKDLEPATDELELAMRQLKRTMRERAKRAIRRRRRRLASAIEHHTDRDET